MTSPVSQQEIELEERQARSSRWENLRNAALVGLGALGGLFGGIRSIWEQYYDEYKMKPGFTEMRIERFARQDAFAAKNAVSGLAQKAKNIAFRAFNDANEKTYMKDFYRMVEDRYGVVTPKFEGNLLEDLNHAAKGTWQRFMDMKSDRRGTAIFNAGLSMAVTAITVGAFINLANNQSLRRRLDDVEAQQDAQNPAPARARA